MKKSKETKEERETGELRRKEDEETKRGDDIEGGKRG